MVQGQTWRIWTLKLLTKRLRQTRRRRWLRLLQLLARILQSLKKMEMTLLQHNFITCFLFLFFFFFFWVPCLFWGYWTIYNFFIYIYVCVCVCVCVCLPSLHSCGLWILLVYISCFAVICFVGASSSSILGLEKYFARACSLSILGLRKFFAHLWILLRHSSASALVSSYKTFIYSWSKIQRAMSSLRNLIISI